MMRVVPAVSEARVRWGRTICAMLLIASVRVASALSQTGITIETAAGEAHAFSVEIAATDEARQRGLMYRENLPADGGMLFRYDTPHIAMMWMKNTLIPLDILFVREDGVIATIAPRTTPRSLRIISASEPVIAVVELNGGTCERLRIRVGDRVRHPLFEAQPAVTSDSAAQPRSPSSTAVSPPGGAPHR